MPVVLKCPFANLYGWESSKRTLALGVRNIAKATLSYPLRLDYKGNIIWESSITFVAGETKILSIPITVASGTGDLRLHAWHKTQYLGGVHFADIIGDPLQGHLYDIWYTASHPLETIPWTLLWRLGTVYSTLTRKASSWYKFTLSIHWHKDPLDMIGRLYCTIIKPDGTSFALGTSSSWEDKTVWLGQVVPLYSGQQFFNFRIDQIGTYYAEIELTGGMPDTPISDWVRVDWIQIPIAVGAA